MATYNGEKYIKEQIDTILTQLSQDDELIISDDGSRDKTIEIINSYNDNRIKLLINNSHCYTSNFENALNNAKGDYIFLSDQDDIWLPNKVEVCLKYLQNYDFVMTDAKIVDKDLNIIYESRNQTLNVRNGFWNNFIKTKYLGCCMAFKRKILEFALPFPNNHQLCLHDAWISLLAERYFKTIVINEIVMLYRRHECNVSNGANVKSLKLIKSLKIRLYLIFNISKRRMLL